MSAEVRFKMAKWISKKMNEGWDEVHAEMVFRLYVEGGEVSPQIEEELDRFIA